MEEDMKKKNRKHEGETPEENQPVPEEAAEQEAQPAEEGLESVTDLKPLLEASRQKAEEYLNLAQAGAT